MMVRIAAVQLHYLPSYFEGGDDYLSEPLVTPPTLEDPAFAADIKAWRQNLRHTYCELFTRKLKTIVSCCAAQNCRLIVFPEYSVPLECLSQLRVLSAHHKVAILAGSSRIHPNHSHKSALPEADFERLNGRAVATLFDKGHATVIAKVHPSPYDLGVGAPPGSSENIREDIVIDGLLVKFWICSDYLARRPQDLNPDVAIIVSNTPALGAFVVRIQSSGSEEQAMAHAYRLQKQGHKSIFVNNATRGGTKGFFENRHRTGVVMDAADGTWDECDMFGNQVAQCGIPASTEAIVITDVSKRDTVTFSQYAIIPIVHCTGPDDSEVDLLMDFVDAYRASHSLASKVALLRLQLPELRKTALSEVLRATWAHLETALESITDEQVLDRLVLICVVHEEAPSCAGWIYRACISTIDKLTSLARHEADGSAIEELIGECREKAHRLQTDRQVSMSEPSQINVIAPLTRAEWLKYSAPVRSGIANCRSGSGALIYAVNLVRHLLQAGETDDAIRIIKQAQDIRPYLALGIIDDLKQALALQPPDVMKGIASCDAFLREREREKQSLRHVCIEAGPTLKGAIIAYGFSDLALMLLSATPRPRRSVFVAECRNRAHIEAGLAYAHKISDLGFPVTYISDATLAHFMYERRHEVGTVLMGFTLAGPDGVLNTVGSLGVSMLAKECGAEVVFVGQSFKIVHGPRWHDLKRKSLEIQGEAGWLGEQLSGRFSPIRVADPKSDLVPWKYVGRVITEHGAQSASTLHF